MRCDLNDRAELEKLQVGSFEHLIVLSDDSYEPQHADARTLVTLLHLRDMQEKLGETYSIVTEMNDDANREVAEVTKADDFVVSTKLISLYLTQLSENRQLAEVFAALFDPEGAEIHLKPAPQLPAPRNPGQLRHRHRGRWSAWRDGDRISPAGRRAATPVVRGLIESGQGRPAHLGCRRPGHRAGRHLIDGRSGRDADYEESLRIPIDT